MNIQYTNIRKINAPLQKDEIIACGDLAMDVDCGYLEVLTKYGVGQIAGGIDIIHPNSLKESTEEHLEYVQDDAKRPKWLGGNWKKEITLVAGSASRVSYWYHPKCKNGMLIYDGDFDEVFVNPWGFADPRHGFLDDKMFYGRNYELIFDSKMNTGNICASGNGKTGIVVNPILTQMMEKWHSPCDLTRGDIYEEGVTMFYMAAIGGYVQIENRTHHSIIDMISISFDINHYQEILGFIKPFKKSGYKIYDYVKEAGS